MNTKKLVGVVLALLVAACGGSDGTQTSSTPQEVIGALRAQALTLGTVPPAEAARQLMDFGENHFPQYFPTHEPTQSEPPFAYRYYPQTQLYLGVVLTPGTGWTTDGVYVMGGAFGPGPQFQGLVTDFITPVPPAPTFNLDAAYATVLAEGLDSDYMADATGSSDRRLVAVYQPTTDGPLLGQTFRRSLMKVSYFHHVETVVPQVLAEATVSYTLSPTVVAGHVDAQGNLTRYVGLGTLPTAGSVGQSGAYARAFTYAGPAEVNLIGEALVSWSLEADTTTTAWGCLTFTAAGAVSRKECLRIDSAGTVSATRMQVVLDGATLAFQRDQLALPKALPYTLLDGRTSRIQTARTSVIPPGTWGTFWDEHAGNWPVLPVDLLQQMVTYKVVGQRPSACWGIALVSVTDWPDRIAIRYRETVSAQPCAAIVVSPALVLAIPQSSKPVEWVAARDSEPTVADEVPSANVSASYDPPVTGACRRLRVVTTLPARQDAAATDLSMLDFSLLDGYGYRRATTWEDVQISVGPGFYRLTGTGCPGMPAHGTMWPLLRLKLHEIEYAFFAPSMSPTDAWALPVQVIHTSVGPVSGSPFVTMSNATELASFWADHETPPVPSVDFTQQMAAAVLLGENNDCHRIEIDAAVEWPDHIEVEYGDRSIPGLVCPAVIVNSGATTVFTLPRTAKPLWWIPAP